jgi:hypothetical protein
VWQGGTAPTLTTTASACDLIQFYYDGTTMRGWIVTATPGAGGGGGGSSGITGLTSGVTASGSGSVAATVTPTGIDQGVQTQADLASAATTSIGAAVGRSVHVTGSTGPITSFGNCTAGNERVVIFTGGPLVLTHNATSLILKGEMDHTVVAGSRGTYLCDSTNNWRELDWNSAAKRDRSYPAFPGFRAEDGVHSNAVDNLGGWVALQTGAGATGAGTITGSSAEPYLRPMSTGTTTTGNGQILLGNAAYLGAYQYEFFHRGALTTALSNGTDTFTTFMGLSQTFAGFGTDAVGFIQDTNSDYQCVTRKASTSTQDGSGVTVTVGAYHDFFWMTNLAGTTVDFWIDDVKVCSQHTTNIPLTTTVLWPTVTINKSAGTSPVVWTRSRLRLDMRKSN